MTPHYPAPRFPERGAFVERLVRQWDEHGVQTRIIAPDALPVVIRSRRKTEHPIDPAGAAVIRPSYMSYGNAKRGLINRYQLTRRAFVAAVLRGARRMERFTGKEKEDSPDDGSPDLVYGKFLFRGGEGAIALSRRYGVPAVADLGESWSFLELPEATRRAAGRVAGRLTGIVCVSERLREEMIALGADPRRIIVAPNDVDQDRFRPIDRGEARRRLNLPEDRFIVGFAGHFVERKGPLRVARAIENLNSGDRPPVAGVFLGRGEQAPQGEAVLFAGSVPNDQMPLWLNAIDVFVLPTLGEGHCNVLNEAIACVTPIVTSDIPDVRAQVDPSFAVLVDPQNVREIADAIDRLRHNPETAREMTATALRYTDSTGGGTRAGQIIGFLRRVIEEWNDG